MEPPQVLAAALCLVLLLPSVHPSEVPLPAPFHRLALLMKGPQSSVLDTFLFSHHTLPRTSPHSHRLVCISANNPESPSPEQIALPLQTHGCNWPQGISMLRPRRRLKLSEAQVQLAVCPRPSLIDLGGPNGITSVLQGSEGIGREKQRQGSVRKARATAASYEDGGRMHCGLRSTSMPLKTVTGTTEPASDRD